MSATDRQMWLAVLAKLVAPTEPIAAAKAMTPMMALMKSFPDQAFTTDSARHVATTGRIMSDGSTAPLNRVPTYGELEKALGRWWWTQRERAQIQAQPIARKALPGPVPQPREQADPAAVEAVRTVVRSFVAERAALASQAFQAPDRRPKPLHLSSGQLLTAYEAQQAAGAVGLDGRVAVLRRQMGLDSGADDGAVCGHPGGVTGHAEVAA